MRNCRAANLSSGPAALRSSRRGGWGAGGGRLGIPGWILTKRIALYHIVPKNNLSLRIITKTVMAGVGNSLCPIFVYMQVNIAQNQTYTVLYIASAPTVAILVLMRRFRVFWGQCMEKRVQVGVNKKNNKTR